MICVRQATPEDAERAIDVVRGSIQVLCQADHGNDPATLARWLANKTPENFVGWLANPDNYCAVAARDSIEGVGMLHRSGEIRLFYLAPEAQRHGLGSAIHAALERAALRWGLDTLHLQSTRMACPFYEAMGYVSTGPAVFPFGVLRCYPYEKRLQPDNSSKPNPLRGSDGLMR